MKKTLICLMLILCLILPCFDVFASAELNGYDQKNGYEYVLFGRYPTDADGKEQPILWRVLRTEEDHSAYLLSEYILEARQLHWHYDAYESWETSDMYVYLNGDFKNAAFSRAEQAALLQKTEDGALVTLINSDEMRDASIGFKEDKDRLCLSTDYAKSTGLYIYSHGHKYSPWWSRTRSTDNPDQQRRVMNDGKTGRIAVTAKDLGMRPALYLNLDVVNILSGNGSMEDPYVLSVDETLISLDEFEQTSAVTELNNPETEGTSSKDNNNKAEEEETLPEDDTDQPVFDSEESDDQQLEDIQSDVSENNLSTPSVNVNEQVQDNVNEISEDNYEITTNEMIVAGSGSPLFPPLGEDGFLPESETEFVYSDDEEGIWLFASQTLRIEIHRQTQTEPKLLRWYEAEIYCKPEEDMFKMYAYDEARYTNYYVETNPQDIAKQHHLVFAVNGDYFIYRVGRKAEDKSYRVGVVIRNGELMYDIPRNANATVYPPLDVLALYPDGNAEVYINGTISGEELVEKGVRDALSFGPILVENGEITDRATAYGEVENPRSAFGIVEPGHYFCVMLEGRMKNTYSAGSSCGFMAQIMHSLGCKTAINLDGGQTSCMIFMGNRINKIGTYDGKTTDRDREQNEVMGIGISSLVQ